MAEDTPLANAARAMQAMRPAQMDRDEPPASRAFRELSNHVDELRECIMDLVTRINPILSPEMDPGPAKDPEPTPSRSAVTTMITDEDEKLQALIFLVNDTFRRVEV